MAGAEGEDGQAGWAVELEPERRHTPPETEEGFVYKVVSVPEGVMLGEVLLYEQAVGRTIRIEGRAFEPSEEGGHARQIGRVRAAFHGELPAEDEARAHIAQQATALMLGLK
jgi:hypothetical protein